MQLLHCHSKSFNADHADIPTSVSVLSSEVVFEDACTGYLSAAGFPSLDAVHRLLFLFNAVFCNKKTRPKSWGEYYRDSTQVNGRTNLSIISKICNADHADTLTDVSVFSSEVVFKDACTGNLSASGYPSLGTVHLLLFLFNAVLFLYC